MRGLHALHRPCLLAWAMGLSALGFGTAATAEPDDWFSADIPKPDTITEQQFRGRDVRYLQLLRTLADATIRLADTSATYEIGQRYAHATTAELRQAYLDSRREMQAEHPDYSVPTDTFEYTGNPEWPYLQVDENRSTRERLIADLNRLRVRSEYHWSKRFWGTEQRSWRGRQSWWWKESGEDNHAAQLGPARSVGEDEDKDFRDAWADVTMLARALATLLESGPPTAAREESTPDGLRVRMSWTLDNNQRLDIVTDPGSGYSPRTWSHVTTRNTAEEMRAFVEQMRREMEENAEAYNAETVAEMEEWISKSKETSLVERLERSFVFSPWRHTVGGAWLPVRIERAESHEMPMPAAASGDSAVARAPAAAEPMSEEIQWLEWKSTRGRVSPREALQPPPDYEAYTGQDWIDLTGPSDPRDREVLAERLREGLVLTAGEDMYGKGRWLVADADDVLLGQWPIQTGDVFLLAGCTCLEPIEIEPDAEGRGPIEKIAKAIADAEPDDPATLRVARGDRLLDMVCWVPKSERAEDLRALQDAMLKSHEYPPLPYEDAVAFAEAVLAATDDLVRGTGE